MASPTKGKPLSDTEPPHRPLRGHRRGVAADELRRHNLTAVLDRLHLSGALSRSELTSRTGLNRSTIADLIGELGRLGLVEEGPAVASSGPGRPSSVARTRPEGAIVLALELSVDSIAVATVGLGGHVFNQLRLARPRGRFSPEETVDDVVGLAAPLLSSLPDDHRLVGVGVAVAGVVRRRDGFVHLAPNLGWRNIPLGSLIATRVGVGESVWMANEADLGALAEYRRGAGAGASHLVYIAGEAGIGAGIIQDGRPMLGADGYAGEVGHMLINPAGRPCRCGSRGCWETEAGEEALARRAGLADTVGLTLLDHVMAQARAGDPTTLAALEETGRWLGLGVGNLINMFNPDLVVLGGIHHELLPFLDDAVVKAAEQVALEAPTEGAAIVRGQIGVDAALMGAAELALSGVISDPASVAGIDPTAPPAVQG